MIYSLPYSVEIGEKTYNIRNNGDFRIILECITVLNDIELTNHQRAYGALVIFYEDYDEIGDYKEALSQMMWFINCGEAEKQTAQNTKLMDWEHDFSLLVPPVNRIIGYEIRAAQYLHWWTFIAAYMEIGECTFSNIITIRKKLQKGKKLEQWEQEFCRNSYDKVKLPIKLTAEEQAWLDDDF